MGLSLFMKKSGVVLFLVILILGFFIAQQLTKTEVSISGNVIQEAELGEEVEVYIQLKDSIGRGIASDTKRQLKSSLRTRHDFKDKVVAVISQEELEELKDNPNIQSIEEVPIRKIFLQDSVPLVNASNTWNYQLSDTNITGAGETVCILDTGVNFGHVDLQGKNLTCIIDCVSGVSCVENCSATDWNGHGTHVAGIAAANGNLKGVAKGANIISVQVCDSGGTCAGSDTEAGIQWCVDNADTYNISVISMSLGADCDTYPEDCNASYCDAVSPESDEIDEAVANNISVVIAAGNDANKTHISEPACIQNATPVGGTTKTDGMYSNGNRNSLVLLLAPAVSINSTVPTGSCSNCHSSGYKVLPGTSMATPHVSGAIAILNQFRRLEGNEILTPAQSEDALNDTGERIDDSGDSGIFYSRIIILDALKEIDSSAPEITINSHSQSALSSDANQTFNCTVSDALQLANVTFRLYNVTGGLYNETTEVASGNEHEFTLNLTLENGTYLWNCEGVDDKGNSDNSTNYTLKIGAMSIALNSPSDDTYDDTSSIDFNCSVEDSVAELSNITFYLWNSSGVLIHNETENISGSSNSTVFNYTFTDEIEYEWNCESWDNDSNSITESSNYTFTYDNTNPDVTLVSPADGAELEEASIPFKFNVTDDNAIANCSLIIDGDLVKNGTSIDRDETETISKSVSAGTYYWKIRCSDVAGNVDTTSTRKLEVTEADDDDDSSTSSSSSSSTDTSTTIYVISDEDFEMGARKDMKEGDSMKFKHGGEYHLLEVDSISSSSVKVTISSDPITVTINKGSLDKVDIDNNNVYDIEVTYVEYVNNLARILIKQINEPVPIRTIQNNDNTVGADTNSTGNDTIGTENETASSWNIGNKINAIWSNMGKTGHIIFYIFIGAFAILVIGVIGYFNKERIMARIPKIDISIKKRKIPKKDL